jgi:hypothetical protein
MVGRSILVQETLDIVLLQLRADATAAGGLLNTQHSSKYRLDLMAALMYKFFLLRQPRLSPSLSSAVSTELGQKEDRPLSEAMIIHSSANPAFSPVSEAVPKIDARLCSSGEATYTDDLPVDIMGYFGAFVYAEKSHVTFDAIDVTKAMSMHGVIDVMQGEDGVPVGGSPNPSGEFTFAPIGSLLSHHGETIAFVLADTQAHANAAAKSVKVTYGDVSSSRVLKTRDATKFAGRIVSEADMEASWEVLKSSPFAQRRGLPPAKATRMGDPERTLEAGRARGMVVCGSADTPGKVCGHAL